MAKNSKNNQRQQKQNKTQMKAVMDKLANNKKRNQSFIKALTPITSLGNKNKKIKKDKRDITAPQNSQQQEQNNQQPSLIKSQTEKQESINIFAVNFYQNTNKAQKKTIIEKQKQAIEQKQEFVGFLRETFGEKPLKSIKQSAQEENMEEEQIKPTYELSMPEGVRQIQRNKQIQEFRQKLPIYMREQEIVQAISNNLVTLIQGETGSGKSTQIPQFLLEKNFQKLGKIGITQPRRLAAVSLCERVAEQTNLALGTQIGYQIRHINRSENTSIIKFMTDGILFREMNSDPLLKQYGVIVIDEVHERKLDTDILVGLLSKIIHIRYKMHLQNMCSPLRLVLMSATMRVQDFQNKNLFNIETPVIKVEARMFQVKVFHEKNTPQDYIELAVKKCVRIHRRLPGGDVLVFLTGKQQIKEMTIMLELQLKREQIEDEEVMSQQQLQHLEQQRTQRPQNFVIYPLYSSLTNQDQRRVFKRVASNTRKFIISTSIAETSITIPNIKYVVDCGYQKHKYFEGVWKWKKKWGSKAMAQQRAGRAGRTTNGFCYRLYSTAVYSNLMPQYPQPELVRIPLNNTILQIKSIGFPNIYKFPFPTSPSSDQLYNFTKQLLQIGALQGQLTQQLDNTSLTHLGRLLSFIPLDPKLSKILIISSKLEIEQFMIYATLLLTVESIYSLKTSGQDYKTFTDTYRDYLAFREKSDIFVSVNLVREFFSRINALKSVNNYEINQLCEKLHLNFNTMKQLYSNHHQIRQIFNTLTQAQKHPLHSLKHKQSNHLQQCQLKNILDVLLCSFITNICVFEEKNKYKNKNNQQVFIHRNSPLYTRNHLFVCCTSFQETLQGKRYMKFPFVIQNYQLLSSYGKVEPIKECVWKNNQLTGITKGTIYNWEIPIVLTNKINSEIQYFEYGRLMLDGAICQQFKALQNYLKHPTSIIKRDNLKQPVQRIVQAIRQSFNNEKILNKEILIKAFTQNHQFLKKELKLWVNCQNYDKVYEVLKSSIIKSQ